MPLFFVTDSEAWWGRNQATSLHISSTVYLSYHSNTVILVEIYDLDCPLLSLLCGNELRVDTALLEALGESAGGGNIPTSAPNTHPPNPVIPPQLVPQVAANPITPSQATYITQHTSSTACEKS